MAHQIRLSFLSLHLSCNPSGNKTKQNKKPGDTQPTCGVVSQKGKWRDTVFVQITLGNQTECPAAKAFSGIIG